MRHKEEIVNPHNDVVQLCSQGMLAEAEGRDADAYAAFEQAWNAATDDYEACVAAHYLARHQQTPQETLRWNQECLDRADRADRAGDERVRGFYASLHLNMAKACQDLGDNGRAHRHFERAAAHIDEVPDEQHADWARFAIAEGLRAVTPRLCDDLLKDLLVRFCAREDLKALGLVVPAYLADLGTEGDRMRLLTALSMLHAARSLPADEQNALSSAIGLLNAGPRDPN
jgi:tetratricopeptide (TPR) repeat protein